MNEDPSRFAYGWRTTKAEGAHDYLRPAVEQEIVKAYRGKLGAVLDIGCGNGAMAAYLAERGYEVTGFDASQDGIELAQQAFPKVNFRLASVYDAVPEEYRGKFQLAISMEVVEHLYYPRKLFSAAFELLKPGGSFIVTTPYHGYLKNLALSVTGKWDHHFLVDWDGGHIKFFSKKTLSHMAEEAGFIVESWFGVGRAPYLWKSMVMVLSKSGVTTAKTI